MSLPASSLAQNNTMLAQTSYVAALIIDSIVYWSNVLISDKQPVKSQIEYPYSPLGEVVSARKVLENCTLQY